MKRVFASGLALASILGVTAAASAQEPAPPSKTLQTVGRFQQRAIPKTARVSGVLAHAEQDALVFATVVFDGESVTSAHARAQRLGLRFDKASTERQLTAQQNTMLPLLRAAGATVRTTVHTALNAATVQVKVKDIAALAAITGVSQVHVSQKIHRFNGASATYTGVPQAWDTSGLTGAGMTIGILDDGIDYYHADFGGSGVPADYASDDPTILEPGSFPTAKVVGGYDFVGDNYDAGADQPGETDIPVPDPDPLGCGEHGTHVSGTAAGEGVLSDGTTFTGPYDATTITDNDFNVAPGSAPEASIRMYKVFGCDGSVNDDVLLNAIDAAVSDGVDVISMSLGGAWGTADDPIALALDNASSEGILSVVAAGNEGPSAYLVGGPSTADTVLSVAAIDVSSATLPGVDISGDITYTGQNSNAYDFAGNGPVTGELVDVGLGCAVSDFLPAVGKIAVTHRGGCNRVDFAINGSTAGVAGIIFVNNAEGFPPIEGPIAGADVPFVGVTGEDAALFADGAVVTLDQGADIANPAYTMFASFTSNGPRQDSAAKPDISAPGVSILSAGRGTGDEGILLSGTSMATPHTSGIAILVRQAHPSWTPAQIKGALMSSADPDGVGNFNVVRGGAGVVSAPDAVDAKASLVTSDGRDSLSFGFRQLTGGYVAARSFTIVNKSASAITYDMSAEVDSLGTALTVTFNPATVTVPAGHTRSVSVSLKIPDPENLPEADWDTGGDLATVSGLVWATPRTTSVGVSALKTPLVLVPYGVSDIRAVGTTNGLAPTGGSQTVKSIKVSNDGVHYGNYDTYQWGVTDPQGDIEVQGQNIPDIRDIGVQQFPVDLQSGPDEMVVFAISTNNRIATQTTGEYDLYIDANYDESFDYVLVGIDNGLFTSGSPDGRMASFLIDLSDFSIVDVWDAYAPANGSVVELPFLLSDLPSDTPWAYALETYSVTSNLPPDDSDFGAYDTGNPAVTNADYDYLDPHTSAMIPVSVNPTAAADQFALGWLVVSVDDSANREADRVPLRAKRAGRTPTR